MSNKNKEFTVQVDWSSIDLDALYMVFSSDDGDIDFLRDLEGYEPNFKIIEPTDKDDCQHIEGATPIGGLVICKKCGKDLRKVVE